MSSSRSPIVGSNARPFHRNRRECLNKFGESLGVDVWTSINNVFDVMPLAATIDGRIFCCHGGIPPPWVCSDMALFERIPVPLPLPDTQSELAWNLMWNDPIRVGIRRDGYGGWWFGV